MIEYNIDKDHCLILVWMTGTNSCADLAAHYARVLRDPRYERTQDCLFHIDPEGDGPILKELPEVRTVIELLAQCQGATKWAVVISSGFKRAVVEYLLKGSDLRMVSMRFFGSELEAIAWLNIGRKSPIVAAEIRGAKDRTTAQNA